MIDDFYVVPAGGSLNNIEYITQEDSSDILVVRTYTRRTVADIVLEPSGFYALYFDVEAYGAWHGWMLLELGNKLIELNADAQKKLNHALS